jgi:hypothetical protein
MERLAPREGQQEGTALAEGEVRSPEQLVQEVREALARCTEGPDEAGQLNARVPRLGALLGAEAAAGLLQEVLSVRGIAGAEDGQGRSCRAAAVEALLGLGHPHALTVLPEDLAWYRAEGRRLPWGIQLLLGGALAAAATQAWTLGARAASALAKVRGTGWDLEALSAALDRTAPDWPWTFASGLHGVVLAGVLAGVMRSPARARRGRAWQVAGLVLGVVGGVIAAMGRSMGYAWVCTVLTLWASLRALESGHGRGPD